MINSGLGEAPPLSIIVLPVLFEGQVKAVIELASFERFNPTHQAFLEQLTESIGIVLNTIEANMRTEELLKQSQSLAQELQSQQEELQQTNEELEEKAKLLVEQNAEVERKNREVEQAKQALEEKATQLALTSKYKSEFLANMSHELRTPLNSLLILAHQLSDNPERNLSTQQVQFAQTIHGAGSDLLTLINDILDLSKIESGTVTVDLSDVSFAGMREYVERTFRHVAESKNLDFEVDLGEGLPRFMSTDMKRLQQVLKNLLSNAFKFTEKGKVDMRIHAARERLEPEPCDAQPRPSGGRLLGVATPASASIRQAAAHLRGLPAGRRHHQPQVRRHRPGPFHQPRNRAPPGRRNPAAEQARRGQHLHAVPAHRLHAPPAQGGGGLVAAEPAGPAAPPSNRLRPTAKRRPVPRTGAPAAGRDRRAHGAVPPPSLRTTGNPSIRATRWCSSSRTTPISPACCATWPARRASRCCWRAGATAP